MSERVIIVGCGVVGMTAAARLCEDSGRRFAVEIVAQRVALESLSRVPAASFYPFAVDHPHLAEWLRFGLGRFVALARDRESGVVLRDGFEIDPRIVGGLAPAEFLLPSARPLVPAPSGSVQFSLPIVEMPIYLPFLLRRLVAAGASIRRRRIERLDELIDEAADAIVVNCSGVVARRIVPDPAVIPSLGQIVRVAPCGADRFILDERDPERPTYVVPRSRDVVLGSVDRPIDCDHVGYEPPAPDPAIVRDIVERCAALDPRIRGAAILESYCGIRPRRPAVRVEIDRERLARGRRVIHAYGHGGGGVTLSWGTAEDVASLAESLIE